MPAGLYYITEKNNRIYMENKTDKTKERKVVVANRWRTPDGTILESLHQHDYVSHTDKITGEYYFVDGGISYVRTSINKVPMTNCCVYSTDPIAGVRKYFKRGTFDANKKRIWVLLKNLSDKHIQNILRDLISQGTDITDPVPVQYVRELAYRFENNDHVEEHDYIRIDSEK